MDRMSATYGIDLASRPERTAVCMIEWRRGARAYLSRICGASSAGLAARSGRSRPTAVALVRSPACPSSEGEGDARLASTTRGGPISGRERDRGCGCGSCRVQRIIWTDRPDQRRARRCVVCVTDGMYGRRFPAESQDGDHALEWDSVVGRAHSPRRSGSARSPAVERLVHVGSGVHGGWDTWSIRG